jgi:hypothetical protein
MTDERAVDAVAARAFELIDDGARVVGVPTSEATARSTVGTNPRKFSCDSRSRATRSRSGTLARSS